MRAPGPEGEEARTDAIEEEKRAWLGSVKGAGYEATLFPFEMLLKAMDRFFRADNHPRFFKADPAADANLKLEIGIADRQLRHLIRLSQSILDQTDTSAFMFQSYVESRLVTDRDRDALLMKHQDQKHPQESLYLLRAGLQSLVDIAESLGTCRQVPLPAFRGLGQQYASLMVHNRYFNPLHDTGFKPAYDRVEHPVLRRGVLAAETRALRLALSLIILALGRYLRIVGWINPHAPSREQLEDQLPYLTLLCSELRSLIPFLEHALPRRFFAHGASSPQETELISFLDVLTYQMTQEWRKVFGQLLAGFPHHSEENKLRSALENTRGLLTAFLQQSVVSLLQVVLPDVEGKDIYSDFTSRREQSLRLREDLWVFHEMMEYVISVLDAPTSSTDQRRWAFLALTHFLDHFETTTLSSIRLSDLEEFERFFERVRSVRKEDLMTRSRAREIAAELAVFRIFLQTTVELIGKRSDIDGVTFEQDRPRRVLEQFLATAKGDEATTDRGRRRPGAVNSGTRRH